MKSLDDCYTLQNGVRIPCIGLGTWQQKKDDDAIRIAVREAILNGYRHIDTSPVHYNEKSVGLGIKESAVQRENLFVTSKVWNTKRDYNETIDACDSSLQEMGLEYFDLYLIHWPNPVQYRNCWQEKNDETWKALEHLYSTGKVRAIGLSNFMPHHIERLTEHAEIKPMVNQLHLNPCEVRTEAVEYCKDRNIIVEAYSPMETGKIINLPEILEVARKYSKSVAQISLRWSIQRGFLPLPKSVTVSKIIENSHIFDFSIDEESMRTINALNGRFGYSPHPDEVGF